MRTKRHWVLSAGNFIEALLGCSALALGLYTAFTAGITMASLSLLIFGGTMTLIHFMSAYVLFIN